MLQAITTTTPSIDLKRIMHGKYETDPKHAALKARKEVLNKTQNDEEHTFVVTAMLDDFSIIIWAQNMNNDESKVIYSRVYLVLLWDDGL